MLTCGVVFIQEVCGQNLHKNTRKPGFSPEHRDFWNTFPDMGRILAALVYRRSLKTMTFSQIVLQRSVQ
jgi:hypothetical protein